MCKLEQAGMLSFSSQKCEGTYQNQTGIIHDYGISLMSWPIVHQREQELPWISDDGVMIADIRIWKKRNFQWNKIFSQNIYFTNQTFIQWIGIGWHILNAGHAVGQWKWSILIWTIYPGKCITNAFDMKMTFDYYVQISAM